jgi:hypothetical protein
VQETSRIRWVAAIVVLGVVIGGTAFAAIPSKSNGVITGCYSKKTGALRLIDAEAGRTCKQDERKVTWNVKGRRGARGPQGLPGEPGVVVLDDLAGMPCTRLGEPGQVAVVAGSLSSDNGFYKQQVGLECRIPWPANGTPCNDGDPSTQNDVYVNGVCQGTVPDTSDVDGDGFSVADGDCDDNNAAVHPGATEVENGIDDNCDGVIDEGF